MGASGHEHELLVEVVLPEELLGLALVRGETHVASYAIASHEHIASVLAL